MGSFLDSHPVEATLAYLFVGLSLFAFMVVDDLAHGRRFQKRDFHILFWWPAIAVVIFVMGLFTFSSLTSKEDGEKLKKPWGWM